MENNTNSKFTRREVRNIIVVSRNGKVARVSLNPLGKKRIEMVADTALTGNWSAIAIVTETLRTAAETPAFKGASLSFFTLEDAAIKGRIVNANMSKGKETVLGSEMASDEYKALCAEYHDAIIAAREAGIFLSFHNYRETMATPVKTTKGGLTIDKGLEDLQNEIAKAWALTPERGWTNESDEQAVAGF